MKAKLILISFFFLFSCSKSISERQLNTIINSYENNKARGDDSPLGQYTESRFENYARFCDSLKTQLESVNIEKLSEDSQISYKLLNFVLNETIVKYKFKTHWNPILSDGGFHLSLTFRVRPLTDKKSAIKYLKLLKAIPDYINQQKVLIKKGLDAGMGQPLVIFKGYESSYNLHITDSAEENFYYSPFLKLPSQLSKKDKDSLQLAARDVVSNEVIPAFKSVKNFLKLPIIQIQEKR